ncbi:MAG TPA: Na(+)-translocating NADH-quinone reductase subunit F [Flavobacteriaceae bacterium]|nr:Na(+)-translocating NADH-quinone reductase subunit F [Flavobacteriaceae bacterium]
MNTSNRLENAVKKLYMAFTSGKLYPECCKQCAVGTILDGSDTWKHLSDNHGSLKLNYVGQVHQTLGRRFNGYTPLELLHIEQTFLKACGYELPLHYLNPKPKDTPDKTRLFHGLCKTVNLLYRLDYGSDRVTLKKVKQLLKTTSLPLVKT